MIKKILFLNLILIVLLSNASSVFAKNQFSGPLAKIRQIVDISDDLDDETQVLMVTKSKDGETIVDCVCACRSSQWSCTTTECSAQDDKCENVDSQKEN